MQIAHPANIRKIASHSVLDINKFWVSISRPPFLLEKQVHLWVDEAIDTFNLEANKEIMWKTSVIF